MFHTELVLFLWGIVGVNGLSAEPYSLRLFGGDGQCQGHLQVQRSGQNWINVWLKQDEGTREETTVFFEDRICAELGCGQTLKTDAISFSETETVLLHFDCDTSQSLCFGSDTFLSDRGVVLNCSDSVRLVSGQSMCSGSLQIRDWSVSESWTWVCEGALDSRGAEVLCRELGCGPPLLQGELSPLEHTFHCEGNESALLDCPRDQTRTDPETCSRLSLTCSEPLRLVGGASRCEGVVEVMYRGLWGAVRPFKRQNHTDWDLESANAVCRSLDCGSAVSTDVTTKSSSFIADAECLKTSSVKRCISVGLSGSRGVVVVCSDLLKLPEVSVSEGVWSPREQGGAFVLMDAHFQVTCSVEPQYPGGFFQLLSPALNLTLPAVNHSAHFLFTHASPAQKGTYTCVYHLQVFNHNFSSNSSLHISPGESDWSLMVRALVLFLLQLLNFIPYMYYRCQASRGQQRAERAPAEDHTHEVFHLN